ncbi:MAG TPA: isoprenylcysteine carboxylmethyltransferase family protein [Chloroflexia bacterium]|nr:isoprenylcysteine carboxylmethyltransferase family protein [Chloroflexia bacterium]
MSLRQISAILALPGVVLVVIPGWLLTSSPPAPAGGPGPLHLLGGLLGVGCIVLGLALMAQTIRLFASRGQGTLAPWDPPRHLVVEGVYRHVRNPMISGVLSVLLGESLLFGSGALLVWFLVAAGVNMVYIPLLEEPQLAERFGDEYRLYQQHVARWLPRRRPWVPPWNEPEGA